MPAITGTGLAVVIPAQGAAFGDLFNDGRIDVVLNNSSGSPTLLRNVNKDQHHWVEFRLMGGRGPRDATGASVFLTAGGVSQRGELLSGGSFASSNDPRVHFGLRMRRRLTRSRFIGQGARRRRLKFRRWTESTPFSRTKGSWGGCPCVPASSLSIAGTAVGTDRGRDGDGFRGEAKRRKVSRWRRWTRRQASRQQSRRGAGPDRRHRA